LDAFAANTSVFGVFENAKAIAKTGVQQIRNVF
jgi:hypothetical protein